VHPPVESLKRIALDLLFPRWCIGCGREGDYICATCREELPVIRPPVCPRCGRPQAAGPVCPGCADMEGEIDGIRAPFLFDGVIRQAVHELKYRNLRSLAPLLAAFLDDYLRTYPLEGDVLVPVPLHPRRLRERGYNQSARLAVALGRLSDRPVREDALVRTGFAPPQVRSSGEAERRRNVAGAFACPRPEAVRGKRVILIDDVATSGATLNAGAGALKAAGAVSVWGLVLALEAWYLSKEVKKSQETVSKALVQE
jgi:competence protein ComFC